MNSGPRLAVFLCLIWVSLAVGPAWGQANFYEGKTVQILIGAKSGSLEIAAQIVAHHLGKYLPGKPTVIVQHMPGAAHLLATNNVFNLAKPDGSTILAANPNVAIAQLAKWNKCVSTFASFSGSVLPAPMVLCFRFGRTCRTSHSTN